MIKKILTKITAFNMGPKAIQDVAVDDDITLREDVVTAAPMAAGLAASRSSTGRVVDANRATSSKMPSAGIIKVAALSGQAAVLVKEGKFHKAGWNFSGFIGRLLYVGTSGNLVYNTVSGQNQSLGQVCDASGVAIHVGSQVKMT